MLTLGDVVELDLGVPTGSEAGLEHPAVVITAREVLDQRPSVVWVVPLTSRVRRFHTEIEIARERSGLERLSAAQCRSVSTSRVQGTRGNVGPADLARIREVLALLLDLD